MVPVSTNQSFYRSFLVMSVMFEGPSGRLIPTQWIITIIMKLDKSNLTTTSRAYNRFNRPIEELKIRSKKLFGPPSLLFSWMFSAYVSSMGQWPLKPACVHTMLHHRTIPRPQPSRWTAVWDSSEFLMAWDIIFPY